MTDPSIDKAKNAEADFNIPFNEFDEKVYRETIDTCANNNLDINLPNGDSKHAAILFEKIMERAQEEVLIYTGALYEGIFDQNEKVIEKAIAFLKKPGSRLTVAFAYDVEPNVVLGRGMVKRIIAANDIAGTLEIYDARHVEKRNHFAVMDASAFRHETDHTTRSAYANFGDMSYAKQLHATFKDIIADPNAQRVYPPQVGAAS